jgi:tight adherence protein B
MSGFEAAFNSAIMGASVGVLGYSCRGYASWAFEAIESDVRDKLRAMRVSSRRLRLLLTLWLFLIAAVFFGSWIAYGNPIFGTVGLVLMGPLPWYILRRMAQRRREQIEDQLAGSMTTLSGAVRAGLSLAQSLEILADQSPRPIRWEFQQIVAEYKMGKTLEQTLIEAKARLRSENFSMFAAALLASRESGGRLNETVERIAQSVLEFQRLTRKIDSETAQARKSAFYMAMAPPLILLVYYFVDPINTLRLFTTVPGQIMLSCSVVLNVVAYLWARRILTPDI